MIACQGSDCPAASASQAPGKTGRAEFFSQLTWRLLPSDCTAADRPGRPDCRFGRLGCHLWCCLVPPMQRLSQRIAALRANDLDHRAAVSGPPPRAARIQRHETGSRDKVRRGPVTADHCDVCRAADGHIGPAQQAIGGKTRAGAGGQPVEQPVKRTGAALDITDGVKLILGHINAFCLSDMAVNCGLCQFPRSAETVTTGYKKTRAGERAPSRVG